MWFQNTTLKKIEFHHLDSDQSGTRTRFLEFSLLINYDDNTKLKESFLITKNMNITFEF